MTRRVPRNLALLGVVSLLTDLSTEMVYPLLPVLLASLGAGGAIVGLMEGAAESVASLLKFASGRWSDLVRRRKAFAVAGYGLSALTKLGYLGAALPWHVVALRSADRVGKGLRTAPRDALIAESMPRARWGYAFGLHRALDNVGAFLAPVAGVLLLSVAGLGIRDVFAVALVPAALGVAVLLFVREGPGLPGPPRRPVVPPWHASLPSYLLTVAVFTLANFALLFLLLRGAVVGLDTSHVLVVFAVHNAVSAGLSWPLGSITDRVGRAPVLAAAFALHAAACLLIVDVAPTDLAGFLLPAAALGAASAAWEGNGRALASDLAPPHRRATVLGAYHGAVGIAALPGGLLAGLLWDLDPSLPFLAAAVLAGAAAVEILWLHARGRLRPLEQTAPGNP